VHLIALRCSNHGDREAAALCSRCRKPHCRECVTEHDGFVLCNGCLAAPEAEAQARFRFGSAVSATTVFLLSVVSLLLLFALLGKMLLAIPAELHEGTVWHSEEQP